MTEHFKALTQNGHASAVAKQSIFTGRNIKWDHFEILASGQCNLQCKIKETLLIRDLKPALNENVGSENIFLWNCEGRLWRLVLMFAKYIIYIVVNNTSRITILKQGILEIG